MSPYATLTHAGFKVQRHGEESIKLIPRNRITEEWRQFVRDHRTELLAALPGRETKQTPQPVAHSARITIPGGVGTELEKQIPKWFASSGCGCHDYARQLDRKGITWCDEHRDVIIAHLVEKASETFLGSLSKRLDRLVATRWVKTAIDNARAKKTVHCSTPPPPLGPS